MNKETRAVTRYDSGTARLSASIFFLQFQIAFPFILQFGQGPLVQLPGFLCHMMLLEQPDQMFFPRFYCRP